jgi:hypothetical protein
MDATRSRPIACIAGSVAAYRLSAQAIHQHSAASWESSEVAWSKRFGPRVVIGIRIREGCGAKTLDLGRLPNTGRRRWPAAGTERCFSTGPRASSAVSSHHEHPCCPASSSPLSGHGRPGAGARPRTRLRPLAGVSQLPRWRSWTHPAIGSAFVITGARPERPAWPTRSRSPRSELEAGDLRGPAEPSGTGRTS